MSDPTKGLLLVAIIMAVALIGLGILAWAMAELDADRRGDR